LRETSRLIADPLNCTLRLNVIFHFFLTNLDFSLYTNKLKETFSAIIIRNVFSIGCSVHPSARPHRSSDAKPEWNTRYMRRNQRNTKLSIHLYPLTGTH
jgi:hypothetical protein